MLFSNSAYAFIITFSSRRLLGSVTRALVDTVWTHDVLVARLAGDAQVPGITAELPVTSVINHCIRVSNVNATVAWITCHICSLASAASWLPSDLLVRPVQGNNRSRRKDQPAGSSIGEQLCLKLGCL